MNDELIWVIQAQQGSDEAFTRLVEEHQTHVYNLCYRMLGEPEAAEDAAQESFLRAYQNLHRYDQNRPFATWLLSIAAHYCIDRLRRRKLSMFSLDGCMLFSETAVVESVGKKSRGTLEMNGNPGHTNRKSVV